MSAEKLAEIMADPVKVEKMKTEASHLKLECTLERGNGEVWIEVCYIYMVIIFLLFDNLSHIILA